MPDQWAVRDVLPDSERRRWLLGPFQSVGPLRFGMRPEHDHGARRREEPTAPGSGASFDALGGPQVLADGMALVGRAPSEVE